MATLHLDCTPHPPFSCHVSRTTRYVPSTLTAHPRLTQPCRPPRPRSPSPSSLLLHPPHPPPPPLRPAHWVPRRDPRGLPGRQHGEQPAESRDAEERDGVCSHYDGQGRQLGEDGVYLAHGESYYPTTASPAPRVALEREDGNELLMRVIWFADVRTRLLRSVSPSLSFLHVQHATDGMVEIVR